MQDYSDALGCIFMIIFFVWAVASIALLIKVIYQNSKVYFLLLRDLKEEFMPMVKGAKARTKKGFSENVKTEMEAGKPQKQAVAIAYSEAGEKKKKKKAKK